MENQNTKQEKIEKGKKTSTANQWPFAALFERKYEGLVWLQC